MVPEVRHLVVYFSKQCIGRLALSLLACVSHTCMFWTCFYQYQPFEVMTTLVGLIQKTWVVKSLRSA